MKKIFTILFLVLSGNFIFAESTYLVGPTKTYKTISEAWSAIKNDVDNQYKIIVDEGIYIEGELKGIPNIKILISGAGADKTIIKRKDVSSFSLLDGQQCGYLFRSTKNDVPLANNMEIVCENMAFQYIGASKTNWGAALVLDEAQNQKYTFRNCNFKNIYARMGALIATTAATTTPVAFSMENCFVEDCGEYEYNYIGGMIYLTWGGNLSIKNTTFMNTSFELHNQHPTSNTGVDFNRKNGLIIHVQADETNPSSINLENVNIIHTTSNADETSLIPFIKINAVSAAAVASLNITNMVAIANNRTNSADCDLAYSSVVSPNTNTSVFNAVKNITSQLAPDGSTTIYNFNDVSTLVGASINQTFSYTSPEVAFELDGNLPKIYTNSYGAKYLNRILTTTNEIKCENTEDDWIIAPSKGVLKFNNLNNRMIKITIFDALGRQRKEVETSCGANINLESGIYLVKVGAKVVKVVL